MKKKELIENMFQFISTIILVIIADLLATAFFNNNFWMQLLIFFVLCLAFFPIDVWVIRKLEEKLKDNDE